MDSSDNVYLCIMNSGFLSDTDVIAEMTSTFADAEVISRGSSFFIARASRYGRRWILKGINPESAEDVLARQQILNLLVELIS